MRKVTVDRGESGPRWPSPCIAEDRNGFTVFHLPGFAVPKIALVSSLLSPKCASAQPSFPLCSHPRRRAPPPVTTHSANALNTQHSHISPRHPLLETVRSFSPPSGQLLVTSSPPPSPFWGTGTEDAMRAKVPGNCFDPGPCRRPARDYRSRSPIACRPILAPPRPLWAPRISVFASLSRLEIAYPLGCATPNEEWPVGSG